MIYEKYCTFWQINYHFEWYYENVACVSARWRRGFNFLLFTFLESRPAEMIHPPSVILIKDYSDLFVLPFGQGRMSFLRG
jgi:hypothetical protein